MAGTTRREKMRHLLARREERGLTYRELAAESGVSAHTLSWWAWKLRQEAAEPPAFIELVGDHVRAGGTLELELAGGRVLRVPVDFDEDHLRRLLGVLATC